MKRLNNPQKFGIFLASLLVLGLVLAWLVKVAGVGYFQNISILVGITVIATMGVAILTGYTGLFTIGHAGFMAVGGYLAAILAKEAHLALVPALLGGGLAAGLVSFIIGYPAFRSRLRGDYFAIATLGFAEAIRLILNNVRQVGPINLGGAYGYMDLPTLDGMIWSWLPKDGWGGVIVVLAITLLIFIMTHMFMLSQWGKNCIAVGQDEIAAQMMGVNLMYTKMMALFISAFFAGLAGGLMAFYYGYLTPGFFMITRSSDLLAGVVFGGIQSVIGPTITSAVLVAVPEVLRTFAEYRLIVYGLFFVIVMVFRPQGLLGYCNMNFDFLRHFWRRDTAGADGK
ncbi:MAG: branched-chain amino acid ABC transporter permease [Holophaga sp.]|nr:branched-chain amino acid ABC transporter permease [Holophaga sp.]